MSKQQASEHDLQINENDIDSSPISPPTKQVENYPEAVATLLSRIVDLSQENLRLQGENHRLKISLKTDELLNDLILPCSKWAYGRQSARTKTTKDL